MDCCRRPIEYVEVPGMNQQNEDLHIPGVNANQVDNIDLPGVDEKKRVPTNKNRRREQRRN